MPHTGDLAHNPGMCPDWELNQRPFASQAGTQPTEPHQPGLYDKDFTHNSRVKSAKQDYTEMIRH